MDDLHRLGENLGCLIGELPMTYLGMFLGATYKAKDVWQKIEERSEKKLATWKRQYLSLGGSFTVSLIPCQLPYVALSYACQCEE